MKKYKYKAVAFSGPSNSGKTTLIEKLAKILTKGYKVLVIKHDPKDKAKFDVEGKDSYKFSQTGAEVVVTSPTRTTYFSQREKTLDDIVDMLNNFDILLVEGLKTLPLPRIAIFRNKIDESYFSYSEAIAIDNSINLSDYNKPKDIDILDLNNTQMIPFWRLVKSYSCGIISMYWSEVQEGKWQPHSPESYADYYVSALKRGIASSACGLTTGGTTLFRRKPGEPDINFSDDYLTQYKKFLFYAGRGYYYKSSMHWSAFFKKGNKFILYDHNPDPKHRPGNADFPNGRDGFVLNSNNIDKLWLYHSIQNTGRGYEENLMLG